MKKLKLFQSKDSGNLYIDQSQWKFNQNKSDGEGLERAERNTEEGGLGLAVSAVVQVESVPRASTQQVHSTPLRTIPYQTSKFSLAYNCSFV